MIFTELLSYEHTGNELPLLFLPDTFAESEPRATREAHSVPPSLRMVCAGCPQDRTRFGANIGSDSSCHATSRPLSGICFSAWFAPVAYKMGLALAQTLVLIPAIALALFQTERVREDDILPYVIYLYYFPSANSFFITGQAASA